MASPLLAFLTPAGSFDGLNGSFISWGQADNGLYIALNDYGTTPMTSGKNISGVFVSSRLGGALNNKTLNINGSTLSPNNTDVEIIPPTTISIFILAENRAPAVRFFPGVVRAFAYGLNVHGKDTGFANAWLAYKAKWLAHPYDRILSYAALKGYATPSAPQQLKQRQLIDALIAAGVWDGLDVFYNFYTNGSADFAKINWKNPGAFQAIGTGHELVFSVNNGFTCTINTQWLDTGYIPFVHGVNWKSNDASWTIGLADSVAGGQCDFGNTIDREFPNYGAGGSYELKLNGGGLFLGVDPTALSFMQFARNPSGQKLHKLGALVGSAGGGGVTPSNLAYHINGFNLDGAHIGGNPGRIWQVFAMGGSQNGKETAFFNAWIAYKSAAAYSEIIEYAIANAVALPSAQQQAAGELLIYDMMNIGIWDKLDVFYNFYTDAPSPFFGINWKNPAASSLSVFGGISFIPNNGVQGDGLTGYVSTGIIPGVTTESLKLNSAGIFMDVNTVTPGAKALFGAVDPGVGSIVFYPSVGGISVARAANDTDISWTAPNPANGFWLLERNAVDEVQSYLDYDMRINSQLPSTSLPGFELFLFAANNAGVAQDFSDAVISCVALGGSFKQIESRMFQAWETYKARAV